MASLNITSATPDAALLDLPWHLAIEEWPADVIAALPKGISRHVVRFVNLSGGVVAVKETTTELASREYDLLRALRKLDVPCVKPVAVVSNRRAEDGEELASALVTKHLKFSLPYRALYSQNLRPDTAMRLVYALAVLLVRLHTVGFYWGDVSLSNTLFRRDAGAFAAYLVDAETGKLYPTLSDGQREDDLEIARVNIAGELLDLAAGGKLADDTDPVEVSAGIVAAYRTLWGELTGAESFAAHERWRIANRVERLNQLGFDVEELEIVTDAEGTQVRIQPKVVDAGHHQRRLLRMTGLDAGENQARRLLNDLDSFSATRHADGLDDEQVAHEWLTGVFEPVVRSIPRELQGKLEPAEAFHLLLDHRWKLSRAQERDVPLAEAMTSFIDTELRHRRDEVTVLNPATEALTLPTEVVEDWRDKV